MTLSEYQTYFLKNAEYGYFDDGTEFIVLNDFVQKNYFKYGENQKIENPYRRWLPNPKKLSDYEQLNPSQEEIDAFENRPLYDNNGITESMITECIQKKEEKELTDEQLCLYNYVLNPQKPTLEDLVKMIAFNVLNFDQITPPIPVLILEEEEVETDPLFLKFYLYFRAALYKKQEKLKIKCLVRALVKPILNK